MRLEMGVCKVTKVDGAGAVLGELMGGSAADSEVAVGAYFECESRGGLVEGHRKEGGNWGTRVGLGRVRHTGDDYNFSFRSRTIGGTGYFLQFRYSLKSALVGDRRNELLTES